MGGDSNISCRSMMKAVIYARVSSVGERQSTERQVADLKRYAAASGMEVVEVFEEKASGTKKDREQLAECLAFLKGGGAEHLLVTELSRLGRSLRQVLEVVDELTERGVNIYFQAQGLNTLVDGKPDATVKAMVSMFGAFAELERTTIIDRLQSGRELAKEKGVKMGRPEKSKESTEEFLTKYKKAVKRLRDGRTIREVAGEFKISTKTVQKIRKVLLVNNAIEKIMSAPRKQLDYNEQEVIEEIKEYRKLHEK